jgi:hypothetical protein
MSSARRAPVVITLATAILLLVFAVANLSDGAPENDSTVQAQQRADEFERQFGFRMELAPGPASDRVWRALQGGGFTVITPETTRGATQ